MDPTDGWYANRTRGIRRQAGVHAQPSVVAADVVPPAQADVRRRWAELLRRIFEVDPLRCPRCGHAMRVVACITAAGVGLVLLTTVAGSLVPGLRAMRVSPVVAMKAE